LIFTQKLFTMSKNRSKCARRLRRIVAFSATIFALWVVCSPRLLPSLYTARLFHPDKDRGSSRQVADLHAYHETPNREVFFAARDGSRLHGWLFLKPGASHIFILFPGNAGDIPRRLEFFKLLLASGASVFTYEARGFGLSQGHATIASIGEDGESAYDYVSRTLAFDSARIVLYGVSLGTTVAAHVSTVRKAAALILQSGFASLPDIAYERVPFLRIYPRCLFPHSPDLSNLAVVSRPHVPLLVMHGALDTLIDMHHSRRIFEQALAPKRLIICPHSSHVNIDQADIPLFISSLSNFLSGLP
jgi:uncharacterized protein